MTAQTMQPTVTDSAATSVASYELLGRLRLASRLDNRSTPPELSPDALHGITGRIVQALTPLTEASPPAFWLIP